MLRGKHSMSHPDHGWPARLAEQQLQYQIVAKPERIIILDSSGTALAVARCARRLGLEPLTFDTVGGIASASRLLRTEIHAGARPERLLARLKLLAQERPSLLIATSDAWLRFLMQHRAELERSFDRILHPGNRVLEICLDKGRFATWCQEHALPAPRHYVAQQPADPHTTLPFPLLVRPDVTFHAAATAQLKAVEVHSIAQLNQAITGLARAQRGAVVCESLLGRPLRQFSVGLARHGQQLLTVVARKLRPGPAACATGTLVETQEDAGVEALAQRVAVLLDYQGIAEVEILQDAATGENFLIEVNPRPWLQFPLGAATGRDLLGLAALGQPRCVPGLARGRRARWLDFRGDLRAWSRSRRSSPSTDSVALWEMLRSIFAANVYARWSWDDQGPFWRDLAELLRLRPAHPAGTDRKTPRAAGSAARFPPPP